ncbi:MAG: hypothetical protein AAF236_16035, partial [Verrucomicrobiota bacterium]
MSRSLSLTAAIIFVSSALAFSQEPPSTEIRPDATASTTEVTPSADNSLPTVPPASQTTPSDSATEAEPTIVRSERSVYVPYEDLEKLFEEEGRGVFLPYKEFLDLWNELTLEQEEVKVQPPADGVVTSANYTATVEGADDQVLAVEAVLEVESFKDEGWAVVPLIKAGLHIAEAETGEATLHLGQNGYELLLPRKGNYQIRLLLYAKIAQSAGRNQVVINLPRAGVSKFEATLPETGWDFEIKPGAAYSTQPVEGDRTRLSFFFGETESFDIVWQKQGEESSLQPLLFVETEQYSRVIPGALQTDISLNYRILRA